MKAIKKIETKKKFKKETVYHSFSMPILNKQQKRNNMWHKIIKSIIKSEELNLLR